MTNIPPPPVAPPPSVPPSDVAPETNPDARTWGMFCHLAALSVFFVPMGTILGPLVVWLIKKDQHPFVNQEGKESLNWQITMAIGMLICIPLVFLFIGLLLLPALGILNLILIILASVKASNGLPYRYPWSIKFLK